MTSPLWSGRDDPDVSLPGTPGDEFTTSQHRPPKPLGFQVLLAPDNAHVLFRIRDTLFPQIRALLSEYRVYFADISILASATDINDPAQARVAFGHAKLVGSTFPGNHGELLEFESSTAIAATRGWYFAVSVNNSGLESDPTPPAPAPANASTSNIADYVIPADVTGAQITLAQEYVNGVAYVRVSASALTPQPLGSFDGFQLYIKGYRDANYTTVVEDGFAQITTQGAGDLLQTSFLMAPDMPPLYQQGTINLTNGSSVIDGIGTNWNPTWAAERFMAFYAYPDPITSDRTLYGTNLVSVASPIQLTLSGGAAPTWLTQQGVEYAIYLNNTQGWFDQFAPGFPHRVTFYFVSISRGGTRRADITNAPSVTFYFGLASALTKPDNPYNVTAYVQPGTSMSSQGAVITLKWNVTAAGILDSTIRQFNIRRRRLGTQLNPASPVPGKPDTIYATVSFDRAMSFQGQYSFVDKAFNTDPNNGAPPDDVDGWDFNPADLGQYVYWVTSVNVEGTENRTAYFGTCTSAGATTIVNTGGDLFSDDFVGATITIGISTYTVTDYDGVTGDIEVSGAVAAGSYDFLVGSTTGRLTLIGHTGAEDDPTVNGDDAFNRTYNSQFISLCSVAGTDEPLATDHNAGYAAAATLADGQPTFRFYFTDELYTTGGAGGGGQNGRQNNQAAGLPPTYTGGSPPIGATWDDNWSVWQYSYSGGAAGIPVFTCAGVASTATTGEVRLLPGNAAGEFSTIAQLVQKRKFAQGMPFVLAAMIKTEAAGSGGGVILMQVVRYDARDFSNAAYNPNPALGTERDTVGGTISCSALEDEYQKVSVKGRLPVGDPATRSNVAVTNGSTTITSAANEFDQHWIGCTATVEQGATTHVSEIRQVTGGTGPTTRGTIVLATAWPGANASDATLDVSITFTHYAVKIGVNDAWDKQVWVRAPMLNSGLLGSAYTPTMLLVDTPGGDDQPADGNPGPTPKPGCVPTGTLVETPDGPRAIELIRPGDVVTSVRSRSSMNRKKVKGTVTHIHEHSTPRMCRITTNAGQLVCSPSHRLAAVGKTYIEAARCYPGVRLLSYATGEATVEIVIAREFYDVPHVPVYSLTIDKVHNYIAGGYLCHNKPPYVEQE